jgi:hypothetical protein
LAIPGSFLVLLFGILTWWAQDIPVWDEGTRWVTVSLVVFLTNVPLIPLIFIPSGKVFDAALVSAVSSGRITSELSAALRDPAVAMARWWEVGTIAVVLLLMVTNRSDADGWINPFRAEPRNEHLDDLERALGGR